MADGSGAPRGILDGTFLSKSQLEQIERVLTHDADTTKYFPE
jgi:hypothetical protein